LSGRLPSPSATRRSIGPASAPLLPRAADPYRTSQRAAIAAEIANMDRREDHDRDGDE
jgi:hypothetical protein